MPDRDRGRPYRSGAPRRSNVDFRDISARLAAEVEAEALDHPWKTREQLAQHPPAPLPPSPSDVPLPDEPERESVLGALSSALLVGLEAHGPRIVALLLAGIVGYLVGRR